MSSYPRAGDGPIPDLLLGRSDFGGGVKNFLSFGMNRVVVFRERGDDRGEFSLPREWICRNPFFEILESPPELHTHPSSGLRRGFFSKRGVLADFFVQQVGAAQGNCEGVICPRGLPRGSCVQKGIG